jgi:predicted nucleic acid-binding protein
LIVLDASVLANAIGDDSTDGQRARKVLLDAGEAVIPDLADLETTSVLRRRWRGGHLSAARFQAALEDLAALPLVRYPARPLLPRIFELHDNVTPHDACYVALAESLGCPLVTADARLAHASGPRCRVTLVDETS